MVKWGQRSGFPDKEEKKNNYNEQFIRIQSFELHHKNSYYYTIMSTFTPVLLNGVVQVLTASAIFM